MWLFLFDAIVFIGVSCLKKTLLHDFLFSCYFENVSVYSLDFGVVVAFAVLCNLLFFDILENISVTQIVCL